MRLDYMTHVGPYIECKTVKADSVRTRRSCTNKDCNEHNVEQCDSKSKFCDRCGSKIGDVNYTVKESNVHKWDVIEAIHEALMPPMGDSYYDWAGKCDKEIWLPNFARPNKDSRKYCFDPKEHGFLLQDIGSATILEEVLEFCTQYKKEIEVLEKYYGNKNVEIKWGLIATIH